MEVDPLDSERVEHGANVGLGNTIAGRMSNDFAEVNRRHVCARQLGANLVSTGLAKQLACSAEASSTAGVTSGGNCALLPAGPAT